MEDVFASAEYNGGGVEYSDSSEYYNSSSYESYDAYDQSYGYTSSYDSYESKDKGYRYDYSVLAVALITLGLILPVELARHKIDHKAVGRPFAKCVLEFLYSELATLGIVEFAIYLAQSYARNWDKNVKDVFAKVHFLLFFAAIINAFMSVMFAYASSSISQRMWVRTEELELDDYIAIREEFSRVEALMEEYTNGSKGPRWFSRLVQMVRHPMLQTQHHKLLIQVRFHELRVHFLKANNLPLKFRVSDYLMKQELHVFQKCVHISTFAWIVIAAAINLCYFLMGIVTYKTGSQRVVGTTLSWIFIGGCISFVPLSYAIYKKMNWIFAQIMRKELIDWTGDEENDGFDEKGSDIEAPPPSKKLSRSKSSYTLNVRLPSFRRTSSSLQSKALRQLDLFWGGDPNLIIGAYQFMQLGYSIACATLLIFWEYIDVYYAAVSGKVFILSLLLCYLTFLLIMAQVIPRYTLCTSLGQLVNRRRLRETLATYKLDEAHKKGIHLHTEKSLDGAAETDNPQNNIITASIPVPATGQDLHQQSRHSETSLRYSETSSDSSYHLPPPILPSKPSKSLERASSNESEKMSKLAELVQTSTAELPKLSADIRRKARKQGGRKKSLSDGVALMQLSGDSNKTPPLIIPSDKPRLEDVSSSGTTAPVTRGRRYGPRQKTVSANVALMKSPASSMFAHPSSLSLSSLASEEKEEESCTPSESGLPVLMEDIPARSVGASELVIPLGRDDRNMNKSFGDEDFADNFASDEEDDDDMLPHPLPPPAQSQNVTATPHGTATKMVRIVEPDLEADVLQSFDATLDKSCKHSDSTSNTSESEGESGDADKAKKGGAMPSHRPGFDIRKFLQSRRYRLMSGVFGTMLIFFIIGMRVEAFLIESNIMPDLENTWHLRSLSGGFWWEVSWLSTFIAVSLLSCFLFCKNCFENDTLHLVYASVFDVVLSAVCLSLLLWAETKRCCQSGPDCCASFGSRSYGGLGKIEPFTALIALRVFRYQFGRLVRRMFKRNVAEAGESGTSTYTKSVRAERSNLAAELTGQRHVGHSSDEEHDHKHHKARHHFASEEGTAVDLWKTAVGLYPEIVKEHGEFSSELLQAMLGIGIGNEHH